MKKLLIEKMKDKIIKKVDKDSLLLKALKKIDEKSK
jgi:hypothetical protein